MPVEHAGTRPGAPARAQAGVQVWYASNASASWRVERLDVDLGAAPALVLVADIPHVFYYATPAGELRHAMRAPDGVDQDCDGEDG